MPRIGLNDIGVFGIALVAASPAVVADDGQRRGECPGYADDGRLNGSDLRDLAHELRVARGTEADIVRKQCGAVDIVRAVHRVGTPQHRDGQAVIAGIHGGLVERIGESNPVVDR